MNIYTRGYGEGYYHGSPNGEGDGDGLMHHQVFQHCDENFHYNTFSHNDWEISSFSYAKIAEYQRSPIYPTYLIRSNEI